MRQGLRKQVKTVRTRKGTAKRTYWVAQGPKHESGMRLRAESHPNANANSGGRKVFKLVAGAALLAGAAYLATRKAGPRTSGGASSAPRWGGSAEHSKLTFADSVGRWSAHQAHSRSSSIPSFHSAVNAWSSHQRR